LDLGLFNIIHRFLVKGIIFLVMDTAEPPKPLNLFQVLQIKVELLCSGITIPIEVGRELEKQGMMITIGRKVGAGPAGGRYFRFPNGSIVNVPLWIDDHVSKRYILSRLDSNGKVYLFDIQKSLPPITLELLPVPDFYSQIGTDGILFQKIALMHGDRTLATTIDQRCHLWRQNEQCKFCAIEFSLEIGATIEHKTGSQIIQAIHAAKHENPHFASHLTLTIGSQPSEGQTVTSYVEVIKVIRQEFPSLPIHIQCEPFNDLSNLETLHHAGADTIGIHLEILDDHIRSVICPGKSRIPKEQYYLNWEKAIQIFGENQVSTFILTGFEEDPIQFKTELREVVRRKVIPILTPARALSGLKILIPNSSSTILIELILYVAKLCIEFKVDPLKNRAGCVLCGGCSAIVDAYRFLKENPYFIYQK
jgi:radical SAM protein (TIGR04043 family)